MKLTSNFKNFAIYFVKVTIGGLLHILSAHYFLKLIFLRKPTLYILNYHNFSKYNNYKIKRGNILETGYAYNFEKQIRFLKKHFNFCYPEDFFAGKCAKGINVLLTFDDGYKDNFDIALPILKKYDAAAIFFITTNIVGSNDWLWHDKVRFLVFTEALNATLAENQLKRMNQGISVDIALKTKIETVFPEPQKRIMMNWEEVKQLYDNGFLIGSHTANHKVLSALDKNEQQNEIESSLYAIKHNLNFQTEHFAFPNGLYNQTALNILEDNNIGFAYTTKKGINHPVNYSKMQLKRIGINTSDSIGVVLLKLLHNIKK